jgi:hypothetical protein
MDKTQLAVIAGGQLNEAPFGQHLRPSITEPTWPDVNEYIAYLQEKAFDKGIELEICHDFRGFAKLTEILPGKHTCQRDFNSEYSRLEPANAFWIKGVDKHGDIVHVQAIRLDDLRGTTLDQHLGATYTKLYCGPGSDAKIDVSKAAQAPALNIITDWVCYHGEFWLRAGRGDNGFRGAGLSPILGRFLFALALKKWSPNFVYGLARHALIEKGIPARYGYMHMQPNAIRWEVAPYNTYPDEWLTWLTREDLIYLTQHLP